jgi:hypothetical protein
MKNIWLLGKVLSIQALATAAILSNVTERPTQPRTNKLMPLDQLHADESIYSSDGIYEMRMQGDCNLVIYKNNQK